MAFGSLFVPRLLEKTLSRLGGGVDDVAEAADLLVVLDVDEFVVARFGARSLLLRLKTYAR